MTIAPGSAEALTPDAITDPAPPSEHELAATSAGLHYVTDAMPGIRRQRAGSSFRYIRPNGSVIRDPATLRRIRALVIPPAWTEVWICPIPEGHIQVTARDAKGRKQYRYHPRYRAIRDETKFGRMLEFSDLLPGIRARLERDLKLPGLQRPKVLATVVWLLERTFIRIGNDEYARENRSYGLTTMRRRHVAVSGDRLRFEFRGKSGVKHAVSITDRRIARIVQHCQSLPGQELFQYLDDDGRRQSVDSGDINAYLREISGREVTAKDFRTWAGTMLAAAALRKLGPAASERQAKANIVAAVDEVAHRLGNTRAVCRKYYVHPAILEAYLAGTVLGPSEPVDEKREKLAASIRRDEVAVLSFIQNWNRDPGAAAPPPPPPAPAPPPAPVPPPVVPAPPPAPPLEGPPSV
jgi:DNA topoisomerase I